MALEDVYERNLQHRTHRAGWLRAAVLGANDGLVSTASLMIGLAAARVSDSFLITAGIAGISAGAMSMAVGEYVSVRAQNDVEESDRLIEIEHLAADPEGEFGEAHEPETHLIPRLIQNLNNFQINGTDYNTPDGTCIRDYIHVVDIAKAHVSAIDFLAKEKYHNPFSVFNLGTGQGNSVLEVIQAFEKVSGQKLPYKIVDRREGDISSAYANTDKANDILGWKAKSTLEEAMASAWKWEQKIRS
jgi:hypothetical protein